MTSVVNSKLQKLDNDEIVSIAAQETGSQYSPEQVKAALVAEVHQAGGKLIREGNTLFIIHRAPSDPTRGVFRPLNADTARNYIHNLGVFFKAVKTMGYKTLIVQFKDPSMMTIVDAVQNKPPIKGMKIETSDVGQGTTQVDIDLGAPTRGGL